MAEMTAEEAIECLKQDVHYYEDPFVDVDEEIIKLIEKQAQQISELHKCLIHDGEILGEYQERIEQQQAEIAKKDRMIRAACNFLAFDSVESADHWRLMIEKEAEVQA